jgi:hypothetical protein
MLKPISLRMEMIRVTRGGQQYPFVTVKVELTFPFVAAPSPTKGSLKDEKKKQSIRYYDKLRWLYH